MSTGPASPPTTAGPRVEHAEATAYTIPTEGPEADGTMSWDATTIVVVTVRSAGLVGTGWTYGSPALAALIDGALLPVLRDREVLAGSATWEAMARALRNIGRPGAASMALSAVDNALWDLRARLLGQPIHRVLGGEDGRVRVYGSGGFTTEDEDRLAAELAAWEAAGLSAVKIKIAESWGTNVPRDLRRVRQVRESVGPDVEVMVDANGGYTVKQALRVGRRLEELAVTWFEEPVSSDDLPGLRLLREHLDLDVAAGEYCDGVDYAARMCAARAVDCLQVDVTRCGGITELLRIAAVAAAHHLEISGHCAPYEHVGVLAALPNARHLEFFRDHARIEQLLFTGWSPVAGGTLGAGDSPGHGLTFDPVAAEPYRVAP
ncbi:putative mandalate racemase [Nostocoides japonicum T1-X7]|uniref:Putative mandalate racemase n=1 Tax=Nostocoides japonicum T1-X7 TaxID=1194083 RepID=A0A077M2Q0_9MICO|nr:enolase C-terminal domain-like protein [Tetrasphaera japonica]CCH79332.1 putative mandalate racemase [Tetrasphaera japonica T1-X7]